MPAIPTPANVVLRCRDQGTSPRTEHNAAARAYLQCPHRMLWPRSGLQACGLQPHVMERRGEVTTDTCTHRASQTHSSTRIRKASGCPATRPFHHGNRCAASGFCAWGIQPQPGNGTVQYHRVPAHRTPSDVVAGLGVHFFPRNRSVDSDCSPSANLGRA
jgi:hypothetical protein